MDDTTVSNVVIVGAGIAGLTAALTLLDDAKAAGKPVPSITILEADNRLGGRVKTIEHEGRTINTGPQWMHGGETNQFWEWIKPRYPDLKYTLDTVENIYAVTRDGFKKGPEFRDENFAVFADAWEKFSTENPGKDLSLAQLQEHYIGTDQSKAFGQFMAECWMGATGPDVVSCTDYFSDPNGPGGVEIKGGNAQVIARMAAEARAAGVTIKTGTMVTNVTQHNDGYVLTDGDGESYHAKHVALSVPLAVLKRSAITFDPPLTNDTREQINGIGSVPMTKIFIPVKEAFFKERDIKPDTHIDIAMTGGEPATFCHLYSNGTPGITILAGGNLALKMEKASTREVNSFIADTFKKIPLLDGIHGYGDGRVFVSDWNTNPLSMGAYTAALPGHIRRGVMVENGASGGTLSIMGEGACLSSDGGGGMSAAHMSGRRAAEGISAQMNRAPNRRPDSSQYFVLD